MQMSMHVAARMQMSIWPGNNNADVNADVLKPHNADVKASQCLWIMRFAAVSASLQMLMQQQDVNAAAAAMQMSMQQQQHQCRCQCISSNPDVLKPHNADVKASQCTGLCSMLMQQQDVNVAAAAMQIAVVSASLQMLMQRDVNAKNADVNAWQRRKNADMLMQQQDVNAKKKNADVNAKKKNKECRCQCSRSNADVLKPHNADVKASQCTGLCSMLMQQQDVNAKKKKNADVNALQE
ncbi:hypothetical protein K7X08_000111 [Anisodus acutangulus]|uniref:Uncharacterized protein n=1 Tax=Anisodus acutangulus TaxID=402998 RepID=A0A9Q1M629_9SOLA|nr:hypothetical protein K7X08_000111 [Anisodus acutangulus]